ncbi:hypothetical protein [Streptomyces sp. MMG1121]|uniref:hypothetical protein n=1 Tax=Streptomyces sp. MMG1121 TaxID=1415544 RepID=UPI0006AEFB33|nr:hypothetical protein [Streptomyces sp. MMG1121]KOV67467.1 hypothetical protein ADK64_08785 [Streptomyces sp. MMG1121]
MPARRASPGPGPTQLSGSADDRILVLDGELALAGRDEKQPPARRTGAYRALPAQGTGVLSSPSRCLALLDVSFDAGFDERVVGLSYFEPGPASRTYVPVPGPVPCPGTYARVDGRRRGDFVGQGSSGGSWAEPGPDRGEGRPVP